MGDAAISAIRHFQQFRRPAARVALALAAPLCLAASPAEVDFEVDFTHLRNHKGKLQVCLTRHAEHFPDCADDPAALKRTLPATSGEVVFADVAPGHYAVAIVHDENGNGKLDTLLGIPREGFGFSRNPPIRFGAPKFAEAAFDIGPGEARQAVRLRYLL